MYKITLWFFLFFFFFFGDTWVLNSGFMLARQAHYHLGHFSPHFFLFFFFFGMTGLNSGLCKAGTLPFEPHLQFIIISAL
jgi:hypothetical protein